MAGLNLFTNNASTTLASGISAVDTTLTVSSGTGALFPTLAGSQYFYTTLSNVAATIIEIVKVTARAGDTFTIVRGQDNTTASAYITGDKVELRLVDASLENFPQLDSTNTFAQAQTFTTAPVFTDATGTRSAMSAAKSGANSDITSITGLTTPLTIAQGGTGAITLRDATIATLGYTTTATAAGTTTLLATDTSIQFFTGVTTQTVVLPIASTMVLGQQFTIHNNSTGSLTINSSGANLVGTATANTTVVCTCILTSGTTAASWDYDVTGFTTALPTTRGGTGLTTVGTADQLLGSNGTTLAYTKVGISNLSATGSPSASTFLAGNNTWATPAGGLTQGSSITGGITNTNTHYPATATTNGYSYTWTTGITGNCDFQCNSFVYQSGTETFVDSTTSSMIRARSTTEINNCTKYNCVCNC